MAPNNPMERRKTYDSAILVPRKNFLRHGQHRRDCTLDIESRGVEMVHALHVREDEAGGGGGGGEVPDLCIEDPRLAAVIRRREGGRSKRVGEWR